jgi:hypothetical protein
MQLHTSEQISATREYDARNNSCQKRRSLFVREDNKQKLRLLSVAGAFIPIYSKATRAYRIALSSMSQAHHCFPRLGLLTKRLPLAVQSPACCCSTIIVVAGSLRWSVLDRAVVGCDGSEEQ